MSYQRMTPEERKKAIEDRNNGIRRTDAIRPKNSLGKEQDGVDMAIKQENYGKQIGDFPQFSDYKEQVLPIIRCFVKIFEIPKNRVPYKESPAFSGWEKSLFDIEGICGAHYERAMQLVRWDIDNSNGFNAYAHHPRQIINRLVDTMRDVRREIADREALAKPSKKIERVSIDDPMIDSLNDLQRRIREGKL